MPLLQTCNLKRAFMQVWKASFYKYNTKLEVLNRVKIFRKSFFAALDGEQLHFHHYCYCRYCPWMTVFLHWAKYSFSSWCPPVEWIFVLRWCSGAKHFCVIFVSCAFSTVGCWQSAGELGWCIFVSLFRMGRRGQGRNQEGFVFSLFFKRESK